MCLVSRGGHGRRHWQQTLADNTTPAATAVSRLRACAHMLDSLSLRLRWTLRGVRLCPRLATTGCCWSDTSRAHDTSRCRCVKAIVEP